MTPARQRPLWRATALAALLAVGLAAPHLTGHDDAARAGGSGGERALAATPLEATAHLPAPCPLCLAGSRVRDALSRAPTLVAALSGREAPLAPRVAEPALRDPRSEPAAPRAPPIG